jgi:archaellum component FlaC
MIIDERLDRLTARHEALTQTVEVIAALQLKAEERMAKTDERMAQLTDTMNRLGKIIIAHEERIDRLEDQQ